VFAVLAGRGQVGGFRLLSEARVESFTVPRPVRYEYDEVIGQIPVLGQGGFWLGGSSPPSEPVIGPSPRVLAHNGAGGSIAWADLDGGFAAAITHNRMFAQNPPLPADRHPFVPIGDAIRESISLGL